MSEQDLDGGARAGDYQARLVSLWRRNLGVDIDAEDDYFEKGGDSLRATQLLSWIHEGFGVELSLLDLFESRTVVAQTQLLIARRDVPDATADKPATEYRFFGRPDERLFGALHRPAPGRDTVGVVLCYPMGQEYMRIHRTYVELARSLAASGRHVLRFDYFGCGDSAGDTVAGNLERWAEDIRQAVRELRSRARVRDVVLVGARIGANLVAEIGPTDDNVAGMVLWEPIVDGTAYLAALQRAHRDLLASNAKLDGYDDRPHPDYFAELVGFPVAKKLYDEVSAIDLLAPAASKGMPETLVVANSDKPALRAYVASRADVRARVEYVAVDESDGIWLKEDRQNKGVIPAQAVQTIVSWISRRAA